MDLFEPSQKTVTGPKHEPLAVRMRPVCLAEVVGQRHILAPGKLLNRAIGSDKLSSIILDGQPGTGKTTLATVISNETRAYFESLNAVSSGVAEIRKVIEHAKKKDGGPGSEDHPSEISDGDARRALNALELGVLTTQPTSPSNSPISPPSLIEEGRAEEVIHFTLQAAQESIQKKAVVYDADGDQHYDTISAFIKSMRGSDPDAALYYLAKMLTACEDPRFIARRLVICAAEDVGNADPQALVVANAAFQVSDIVGMPEARIPLAQATVYIACSPKFNASYLGIEKAMKDVAEGRTLEVRRL